VDRVIYGQLNEFGDAEVAALIAPRPLTIMTSRGGPVNVESTRTELGRARRFYEGLGAGNKLVAKKEASGIEEASAIETALMLGAAPEGKLPEIAFRVSQNQILANRNEHFEGLYHYLRGLCNASGKARTAYWNLSSTPPQERALKVAKLQAELAHLVGVIPNSNIPLNPRTILIAETDEFLTYDVLLDVAPGLEAYGQLLVPRSVVGQVDEHLPAVICQHGFGQAPKYVSGMTTDMGGIQAFGERLAERGYVVFAPYLTVPSVPQAPDWVRRADLTNPIVREAAAVGMMRTSIELAKLHRVVDFLQSLPFVNPMRIGYYGLSYGGYSATWMPPLEPRLKLTIISGYFNNRLQDLAHVAKAGDQRYYWDLPDADFYNWNVLNRFTDLELTAAMWPRPVCIEWGLDDPTTTPAWHREAWAEEKKFIDAWGMDGRIVSDAFLGIHEIHGIGTFFFMDRWLRPERSAGRDYGCDGEHYCDKELAPGFHGYAHSSTVPYVTHELDSSQQSMILGRFYVGDSSPKIDGMALKLSRAGHPGQLVVDLGSQEGAHDLGELQLEGKEVSTGYGLWYELKLKQSIHLDPQKLYWFAVRALPGLTPQGAYTVYGPKPLGGKDYPHNFGLSFRILTKQDEQSAQQPHDDVNLITARRNRSDAWDSR
jgi:dienelactone hydrolase